MYVHITVRASLFWQGHAADANEPLSYSSSKQTVGLEEFVVLYVVPHSAQLGGIFISCLSQSLQKEDELVHTVQPSALTWQASVSSLDSQKEKFRKKLQRRESSFGETQLLTTF